MQFCSNNVFFAGAGNESSSLDEEAFKELASDMESGGPYDHLDTTFEEELALLDEYRLLLLVHR